MAIIYYEIPLSPVPQKFNISLAGTTYRLSFVYRNGCYANWVMDIADNSGNAILNGLPLVEGADLLSQYQYLGLGFSLYCTFENQNVAMLGLGTNQRLFMGAGNGR